MSIKWDNLREHLAVCIFHRSYVQCELYLGSDQRNQTLEKIEYGFIQLSWYSMIWVPCAKLATIIVFHL